MHSRLSVVLLSAVMFLTVGACVATASTRTSARVYNPFRSSGKPAVQVVKTIRGSCWSGSETVAHRDAWRCLSGNFIYDPCFSSPKATGIVLCPATGPWSRRAIKLKLTKKLSRKYGSHTKPSTRGIPWALVTMEGWKCRFLTGATTVVDGKRLNYECSGTRDALWGLPSRKTEPWRITVAPVQATHLQKTVRIRSAWF